MKKKVAKIVKKYGENKIRLIKEYNPISKRPQTSAFAGARRDIDNAIGNILLKASKEEQKIVGETMKGDYFEDWNSATKEIIKY